MLKKTENENAQQAKQEIVGKWLSGHISESDRQKDQTGRYYGFV